MTNNAAGTYGRPYPRSIARWQGLVANTHTLAYRLSGGRLGATIFGMPMLLLTTRGRRTGKLRTAPLLYLPVDGVFVLVASNGGARKSPTWWYNLQTHPEALVQIGTVRARVRAEHADPETRRRLWPLLLQVYPGYARYQSRTDREIPLVLLHPLDPGLAEAVPARYRAAARGREQRT
jgi:deazaflavin-dependent oxidoreductase (nitroreductase family)